jgi:hypothetical protein
MGFVVAKNRHQIGRQITKVFEGLLEEYLNASERSENSDSSEEPQKDNRSLSLDEDVSVEEFLASPCSCGRHCKDSVTFDELIKSRKEFGSLSKTEKNAFMLSQLSSSMHRSDLACSARQIKSRVRQKFDYHISYDRSVCKDVFLFFYGETPQRLRRLQKHRLEVGIAPTKHGNFGRTPIHACSDLDKLEITTFIVNYAAAHGMPDPGRDLRHGKGRLRIFLPSVLNFKSVHHSYELSLRHQDKPFAGYRTFMRHWNTSCPHIVFSKPRTDLCMVCEDFKKELNKIAADLDEKRDYEKSKVHQKAFEHIENAKRERTYYTACTQLAEQHCMKLKLVGKRKEPNSRDIMQHYSWDFAQQLHYPYEDQQVGPIYFKTPRKAQLFGVCCEGMPRQVNYLIDEANFPGKGANTVVSLLDHFFYNYGLGEKHAYLTADNCTGQNKNNAVIQYLLYRSLVGLHDTLELSFMLVGHTKFAPDGYFGLIRKRYRRSNIYTYDNLVDSIRNSSTNEHNLCHPDRSDKPASSLQQVVYRDWSTWLLKYFRKLPDLTSYRHFAITRDKPGIVSVKRDISSKAIDVTLLKKGTLLGKTHELDLPAKIEPNGLSLEREWYLYDHIRMHIPSRSDQDKTCPLPSVPMPKEDRT